jgi:uncharacterized membrane protein
VRRSSPRPLREPVEAEHSIAKTPANRARLFTCLALVVIVVSFVAVWMTIPRGADFVLFGSLAALVILSGPSAARSGAAS